MSHDDDDERRHERRCCRIRADVDEERGQAETRAVADERRMAVHRAVVEVDVAFDQAALVVGQDVQGDPQRVLAPLPSAIGCIAGRDPDAINHLSLSLGRDSEPGSASGVPSAGRR